jgi:valyl-tRNA synthetase
LSVINIDVPPPYVNGTLHLGHIYQHMMLYVYYKLNDCVTRDQILSKPFYRNLNLPSNEYVMKLGVDVNGLPISLKAQESIRDTKFESDYDRSLKLEQICNEIVDTNEQSHRNWYKILGLYDLRRVKYYRTNEHSFRVLLDKFYSKLKLLNKISTKPFPQIFCPNCKTYISKMETQYIERPCNEYHIMAYDENNNSYEIMSRFPQYVIGAIGVSFNRSDERYQHLLGKTLTIRLKNKELVLPVFASQYVQRNVGTGLVMFSPWTSTLDIQLVRESKIPIEQSTLWDSNSQLRKDLLDRYNIKDPKEILQESCFKLMGPSSTKDLCHTERSSCNAPVTWICSPQVTIDITSQDKIKMKNQLKNMKIRPDYVIDTLQRIIDKYDYWCISRSKDYYSLQLIQNNESFKVDTWMLSALTLQVNSSESPINMRLQGSEIIRTWAFLSLYASVILEESSFDELFIHRLVLNAQGQKISKSKNNAPVLDLTDTKLYPLLRYYFLEKPLTKDFRFNDKELSDIGKFFIKFRNLRVKVRKDLTVVEPEYVDWDNYFRLVVSKQTESEDFLDKFVLDLKTFYEVRAQEFNFSTFNFRVKSLVYDISTNISLRQSFSYRDLSKIHYVLDLIQDYLQFYQ